MCLQRILIFIPISFFSAQLVELFADLIKPEEEEAAAAAAAKQIRRDVQSPPLFLTYEHILQRLPDNCKRV